MEPNEEPKKQEEPSRRLSWAEATEEMQSRRTDTIEKEYDFGDGSMMPFTIRGLDPQTIEAIEAMASKEVKDVIKEIAEEKEMQKKGYHMSMNKAAQSPEEEAMLSRIKDEYLKHGIVAGPEGFDPKNPTHLHALPQHVRSDLADGIEHLSYLDIHTRNGFR